MPHVVIEFSKGLEQTNDMQSMCDQVFEVLAAHGEFDASAIKVRATPIEFYRAGTELQTFVHATLFLIEGRDELTRTHLNRVIIEVLGKAFPEVGSITVREAEITLASYAKRLG